MKNKNSSKEELNKLKVVFLKKLDELSEKYPNKKFTSWDVISKTLSDSSGYEVYVLTLKADIDVIKLIAEGLSASSIANRLSIKSQQVYEVANTWGLCVLDYSLDFNPMYLYHKGMSEMELLYNINDVLPIPITQDSAKKIINNVDKYYDFVDFLEEYENEEN